mmetsp:Transcript_54547/g.162089  ORF Transcript_54547/g.162089 Transcript_54547/m.162089 type:complete len:134 (-) Transcript_54547:2756-3157(-)
MAAFDPSFPPSLPPFSFALAPPPPPFALLLAARSASFLRAFSKPAHHSAPLTAHAPPPRAHRSVQSELTNSAWCEMTTTPPPQSRMAAARAPSESRSRKLVGSSRSSTCGSIHSAAPSTTLTFWPPERAEIFE